MRQLKRQRGITLLGFLMVLVVVGFFAYIVMRLFPIYNEYWGVLNAVQGVQSESGVATMSADQIRTSLMRRLEVNYVSSVEAKHITVNRRAGQNNLRVAYEVRTPFMYNIEFVVSFDHTAELASNRP